MWPVIGSVQQGRVRVQMFGCIKLLGCNTHVMDWHNYRWQHCAQVRVLQHYIFFFGGQYYKNLPHKLVPTGCDSRLISLIVGPSHFATFAFIFHAPNLVVVVAGVLSTTTPCKDHAFPRKTYKFQRDCKHRLGPLTDDQPVSLGTGCGDMMSNQYH